MTVPPPASPAPAASAVVSVAFCPCPPLMLPAVEGRPAPETDALRRACADAVAAMLAAGPRRVVVVGDGSEPRARFGAGDRGDLRGFGADLEVAFAGPVRSGGHRVPPAYAVGAWLLDAVGFRGARVGAGPGSLAEVLADGSGPTGLLVMADGSARRTLKAPGYLDPAAEPFDRLVVTALESADTAALAALDVEEGDRLLAAGTATWQATGGALAGRSFTARLRYAEAPFGVGYVVADWSAA